jgi:hypothetical protein
VLTCNAPEKVRWLNVRVSNTIMHGDTEMRHKRRPIEVAGRGFSQVANDEAMACGSRTLVSSLAEKNPWARPPP